MFCLFRPSFEVVKEGRISEYSDFHKTIWGCLFFGDSWSHSNSRSYNLKNCNFFFGARFTPGFEEKCGVLTERLFDIGFS